MRNSNYIKIRREPDEKFLSGFNHRELTDDALVTRKTENPNIKLSGKEGIVRAELELPKSMDQETLRFVEKENEFFIYFQEKGEKGYRKIEIPIPDHVNFQREKSMLMENSLQLFFN